MTPDPLVSSRSTNRGARRGVLVVAALALLFVAGTLAAPLLRSTGNAAGNALHLAYYPLCHQLPERTLTVAGESMAVCARCAGLYAGGAAGLLFAGLWAVGRARPRRRWLLAAFAVTAIDLLLPRIGLPGLSDLPRHLVAWPPGFLGGWFLAVAVADLFRSRTTPSPRPVTRAPLAQENVHG